jgi:endogenous inhibitor of DNA gyrase (YacG/DUF329 family)
MRCPICEKSFEQGQSVAAPFCSERCRTIDLGRWLGEVYHVPAAGREDTGDLAEETAAEGVASPAGPDSRAT